MRIATDAHSIDSWCSINVLWGSHLRGGIFVNSTKILKANNCITGIGNVQDNWPFYIFSSHLPHTLELHAAEVQAKRRNPVDVHLLLVGATQDVKRLVHDLHLLLVVDGFNQDFAEAGQRVVMNLQNFIDLSIYFHIILSRAPIIFISYYLGLLCKSAFEKMFHANGKMTEKYRKNA